MVSTRSKTAQTHLEDYAAPKEAPKAKDGASKKRRLATNSSPKPAAKRSKASETAQKLKRSDSAQGDDSSTVMINRAPVLQLWSACVTHFLYPNLSWSTCISAGSAISTICAVAKGRSIGTVADRDDSEAAQRKREQARRAKEDLDEVHVMQSRLKLKDGLALVGSEKKGKPANEGLLKKKFGDEPYRRVRSCFEDALKSWNGEEDELNQKGFRMYEEFRPNITKGQKGWGRKGELNLETVKSVVSHK